MAKIEIKGPIIPDGYQKVYDWFGIPATSPGKVNAALSAAEDGEEVEVLINSGGGSVFAGSEIYTALKSYKGETSGKVVGIAASAASVAAMGVKILWMSPTAQMMIHRAACILSGNKEDFEHEAGVLSDIDKSIANAYRIKTGLPENELLKMMSKETWLTAQKAKELGFADAVMFEDERAVTNSLTDSCGMLPEAVIKKVLNELADEPKEPPANVEPNSSLEIAKAKAEAVLLLSKL